MELPQEGHSEIAHKLLQEKDSSSTYFTYSSMSTAVPQDVPSRISCDLFGIFEKTSEGIVENLKYLRVLKRRNCRRNFWKNSSKNS